MPLLQRIISTLFHDDKQFNVFMLGLAFMVFYSGFLPTNYIAPIVIESAQTETDADVGNGYTSLAVIYVVFAFANWLAPSVVTVVGPKYCIVIGFCLVSSYIVALMDPAAWSLYLSSFLVGLGAACIWTGHGTFITLNSNQLTTSTNNGIFWAMFEVSLLLGSLIVYFQFHGLTIIDQSTRVAIFIKFLIVAIVGILLLLIVRKVPQTTDSTPNRQVDVISSTPEASVLVIATKRPLDAFRLLLTKDMMCLGFTFVFTGLELGFFSGVYGTAVGFTQQFGSQAKQLVGLNGVFIGAGEITGGLVNGFLGSWSAEHGRDPIFVFGFISHLVAYYGIFLNLPNESPLHETLASSYTHANAALAMTCSFLLGFGDGCFNPQIISLLGSLFAKDTSSAFALYKFLQSLATAVSFFYSGYLHMTYQLAILVVSGLLGTATFCRTEWRLFQQRRLSQIQEPECDTEPI